MQLMRVYCLVVASSMIIANCSRHSSLTIY